MRGDGTLVGQRTRIRLLRLYGAAFLLAVLFIEPVFAETALGTAMLFAGATLVTVGVLGRCWAIVHIGGRKNVELIRSGPYRHSRNPLYLFSIFACSGFGIMSQSFVLAATLALSSLVTFYAKIRDEERYLFREFGDAYSAYTSRTPRLWPRPGAARPGPRRRARPPPYRQMLDTLGLLLVIPLVLAAGMARDWRHLAVLELP